MNEFETLGLRGGIWQGILQRKTPPARLLLVHMGARIAEARATPEGDGRWRITVAIPAERLSDGVQTFLLVEDEAQGVAPPELSLKRRPSRVMLKPRGRSSTSPASPSNTSPAGEIKVKRLLVGCISKRSRSPISLTSSNAFRITRSLASAPGGMKLRDRFSPTAPTMYLRF